MARNVYCICPVFYFVREIIGADPKTIAFLEEHTVSPGTRNRRRFVRRATWTQSVFSNMVCEIRSFNDPATRSFSSWLLPMQQ